MASPSPVHSHPVNLKVLRLSRPHIGEADVASEDPTPSTLLSLPASFGQVYVGETFSCILSINNVSETPHDVALDASVQLPSQSHVSLIHADLPTSNHRVEARKHTQQTLSYEAQEPGLHILTITVSYRRPADDEGSAGAGGAWTTFRKHYQFNAAPGLSVKTKMSAYDNTGHTVEAQIENVSAHTMTLETAEFLPLDGWRVDQFPRISMQPLAPRDVHQTAFLAVRESSSLSAAMGKISISWRRDPVGQKGWLTTGVLRLPQHL
ncbi:hypothetical protein TRICI_000531 [Trichomonascus ciferrii]|uniref:Trafficking protein particle complex subunit 13 n=1 Tax=Trichomonascus ciferrii TaxID=44093 RepID=A0A642VD54_9ASCO|nr:hypothetical protein TRICI_000531 [Trichomonascus ciferrii]